MVVEYKYTTKTDEKPVKNEFCTKEMDVCANTICAKMIK
jgi:hypothetical protein